MCVIFTNSNKACWCGRCHWHSFFGLFQTSALGCFWQQWSVCHSGRKLCFKNTIYIPNEHTLYFMFPWMFVKTHFWYSIIELKSYGVPKLLVSFFMKFFCISVKESTKILYSSYIQNERNMECEFEQTRFDVLEQYLHIVIPIRADLLMVEAQSMKELMLHTTTANTACLPSQWDFLSSILTAHMGPTPVMCTRTLRVTFKRSCQGFGESFWWNFSDI